MKTDFSLATSALRSLLATQAKDGSGAGQHAGTPEIDFDDPAQAQLGRYRLLSRLGSGGMGIVYRARESNLERDVALKVLGTHIGLDEEARARFYQEAKAAARLHHPNIVPVFEIDKIDDIVFFTMALIEGETLSQKVARDGAMDERTAASWLLPIVEAIDYAHRLDVLHLDIKPANILVGQNGEPQLADFGIAQRLSQRAKLAPAPDQRTEGRSDPETSMPSGATQHSAGTPGFMAPEQAKRHGELSVATDIYSLGATIFYLLSGKTVFQASSIDTLLKRLQTEVAPNLRQLNASVSKDMAAICAKCLEIAPSQRYSSAKALAQDLTELLALKPVSARPISAVERLFRWSKRERKLASAIAVSGLALAGGVIVSSLQAQRATRQAMLAAQAEARAIVAAERANNAAAQANKVTSFLTNMFDQANRYSNRGNVPDAVQLLEQASKRVQSQEFANTPLLRAELLTVMARSYTGLSQVRPCIEHAEQAVEIYRANLPTKTAPEFPTIRSQLADAQAALHTCDNLSGNMARTLAQTQSITDELSDIPQARESLTELLFLRAMATGRHGEKRDEYQSKLREFLNIPATTLKEKKMQANAQSKLADALFVQGGQRKEGLALKRSAIDNLQALVGKDDPDLLLMRAGLGAFLAYSGEPQEASKLLDATTADIERVVGKDNIYYATGIEQRAIARSLVKDFDGALADFEAAERVHNKYNTDPKAKLMAKMPVASTLVSTQRFAEASKVVDRMEVDLSTLTDATPATLRFYRSYIEQLRCAIKGKASRIEFQHDFKGCPEK
jgi:serine/threonine protein kinase